MEHGRALFAIRELDESVKILRDAVCIVEEVKSVDEQLMGGEVVGNLESILDRLGGHDAEALTAHSAGMVAYGTSGVSSEDAKRTEARKGVCMHLKRTNRMEKMEEIWQSMDLQIRGVTAMTKVESVQLRR